MVIASKKKNRSDKAKAKSAKPAAIRRKPAAGKSGTRSSASGTASSKMRQEPAKNPAAKKAPPKKVNAKKAIVEPERSAPAMAEVDADVLEFIAAIDDFKQQHGRPFPSWSEVLLIVRQLGYQRSGTRSA